MKREIVKPEYAENWLKHVGQYPNEYIYAVHGTAKKQMRCDQSDKSIAGGDPCVAVSIYTSKTPYFEWESEYIEPNGTVEGDIPPKFAKGDQTKVTVCAECLRASCWQGEFYCEEYKTAGTVEKTIDELKKLALENSFYWTKERQG